MMKCKRCGKMGHESRHCKTPFRRWKHPGLRIAVLTEDGSFIELERPLTLAQLEEALAFQRKMIKLEEGF